MLTVKWIITAVNEKTGEKKYGVLSTTAATLEEARHKLIFGKQMDSYLVGDWGVELDSIKECAWQEKVTVKRQVILTTNKKVVNNLITFTEPSFLSAGNKMQDLLNDFLKENWEVDFSTINKIIKQ